VTGDFRKTLSLGLTMIGMVGRARASRVPPLPVQYRRPSGGGDSTVSENAR
jgi:hypothetical protein